MKNSISTITVLFAVILFTTTGFAQDATKVDPKHYKVEFENDSVRVLRVTYGPNEKSIMHEHPNAVAVFITDITGKFTFPDGKTMAMQRKAGEALWNDAVTHLPENSTDQAFEVILVELKTKK